MVRFVIAFLLLTFAIATDLFGQSSTSCWRDHEKTCRDIAFFEEHPWAPCTVAICQEDLELEILKCSHPVGLVVALEGAKYQHIELAPQYFPGYSNISWQQRENNCGYQIVCPCDGRGVGLTCYYGSELGPGFKPTEYWVTGAQDCYGSLIVP